MEFGSSVYGTRLPTSDTDYKTVFLPEYRNIILGNVADVVQKKTKTDESVRNTSQDVDEECYSLKRYCELLAEGQTVAIDMLFVPRQHWLDDTVLWDELRHNRKRFLSKRSSAFVGYCRKQANKYGIKGSRVAAMRAFVNVLRQFEPNTRLRDIWMPLRATLSHLEHVQFSGLEQLAMVEVCNRKWMNTVSVKYALPQAEKILDEYGHRALEAESNQGVDWKALSHAVRIANQAVELLSTGHVTFPRPERDLLLKIRTGECDYRTVAEMVESGIERVEQASAVSPLPSDPDRTWIEDFVFEAYSSRRS